jgi:outer membrane lipoprotein-sorting protein
MKFLRTASTRRLLATLAGIAVAVGGGTAIAVAAGSGGPVPAPKPLANAIHDALGGPTINGITARVTFTNHLIDSSNIQGSDPLLTGATGRLWLSADHRVRLELQSNNGDAQAVLNNGAFWIYDPTANTVYRGNLPNDTAKTKEPKQKTDTIPSIAQIQSDLNKLMQRANVSGANPTDVAGQPAYSVRITPKHDGGLLGAAELAWDSNHGVPLKISVFARGSSAPVLELAATDITYGKVAASNFTVSPPSGATVVKVSVPAGLAGDHRGGKARRGAHGSRAHVTGVAAVAKRVHFKLTAPSSLVGLPRQSVSLLDWGGKPSALITYGQNLGGIAVIEQPADATKPSTQTGGDHHRGLNLPTISINGVIGQELDTALGTMVRFTRAGVSYIVIGSVPPTAADAAARGL